MFNFFTWFSLVYTISFLLCLVAVASTPLVPFTIEVPNGTTQHGNSRILCPPTTWASMATFVVGNFVAHIATVKSMPGEKLPITVCNLILALLFPTSGLMRGLNAIARCVRLGKSELDKACRAGALCVVVRSSTWRPRTNDSLQVVLATRDSAKDARSQNARNDDTPPSDDVVENVREIAKPAAFKVYHPSWLKEDQCWWIFFDTIWGRSTINTLLFDVHGTYRLPRGYSFAILPRNTIVVPRISKTIDHEENAAGLPTQTTTDPPPRLFKQNSDIASSGSVLKILASIFQLLFSYYTVYRHQGNQIQRWGYVSFFFTPLPYAVMSFCNGISNLLTPNYARLYMVHSEIMDEAEEAGGAFDGVVGRVIPLIGPLDDNGYRSGFASTWKGISPTSIKRVFATVLLRALEKRGSPRTLIPATCTAFSKQVDNSYLLQIQSRENELSSVYKVSSKSEFASDGHFFDDTFDGLTMKLRPYLLKSNLTFSICYALYCCTRHPKRTGRSLKKWSRNPKMPKATADPFIFCVCGIGLLIWSVFHPQRAGRTVRQWAHSSRKLPGTWHGYKRAVRLRMQAHNEPSEKLTQNTVYYQSCSRFQRYDDPIPQKHLSAAVTNTTRIISAPTTKDINFPSASSPRETTDVTWSSIVLPVSFGLLLSAIPIIIIGALSRFHPGSSSSTQRIIIPLWWSSGIILGLLMPLLDVSEILVCIVWLPSYILEKSQGLMLEFDLGIGFGMNPTAIALLAFIPWGVFVAPVWGFVIVLQMLGEWGSCISLY
ncbi:hypothetical protein NA56DRAFT_754538 [Hyaloscypha hepaticicola]|uniref:Uncharacterized protein n=1 Tax=Hyaloscypha hepaticicola TaxID=2082293 RepID=A0A2J6PLK9_9HELO|nr:hypothetical protein NA56DRAFT_754538 [Hyaloscypha hepaticicola]